MFGMLETGMGNVARSTASASALTEVAPTSSTMSPAKRNTVVE